MDTVMDNQVLRAEITRLEIECTRLTAALLDAWKDKDQAKTEANNLSARLASATVQILNQQEETWSLNKEVQALHETLTL